MSLSRSGFVIIDGNFKPEIAVSYGKEHMRILLNDWEHIYHENVNDVFTNLRKEYLREVV